MKREEILKVLKTVKAELNKVLTVEFNVIATVVENKQEKLVPAIEFTCDSELRDVPFTKQEALGKYFNTELFVMGITQRANWINATGEEKLIAFNNGIHPARYGKS